MVFQLRGKYLCNTIMVNMGDEFVPALGAFNGLYDINPSGNFVPFQERRVDYIERRSTEMMVSVGRGIFGYCNDIQAWTFRWEIIDENGNSQSDACDWVAKSSETNTFDILETTLEPWTVRDESLREVILEKILLACYDCEDGGEEGGDEDCGGNGSCSNAVCKCDESFYGVRCEFSSPCKRLALDARYDEFASTRDWSSNFQVSWAAL